MTVAQNEHASGLWQSFLEAARPQVSSYVLDTWLSPIRCTVFDNATVTLEVRDQFSRDWLNDHFLPPLPLNIHLTASS